MKLVPLRAAPLPIVVAFDVRVRMVHALNLARRLEGLGGGRLSLELHLLLRVARLVFLHVLAVV